MMRLTETVKHLIIINVIFFIAFQIPNLSNTLFYNFSHFYVENPLFKVWQYVTSMFMHMNFMHLLLNMLALASFGSALEMLWGRNKFLIFYFATGIGAGILNSLIDYIQFHYLYNQILNSGVNQQDIISLLHIDPDEITHTLLRKLNYIYNSAGMGASGALYGVLVAFAFKFPDAELSLIFLPIPIKARYFVPGLVSLDLILGVFGQSIFGGYGTGIGHFAHIGGALTGYLLMLYFNKSQFRRWN